MLTAEEINREVEAIKERNRRVEADKAWPACHCEARAGREVSWARRLAIAVATYIIAGVWLVLINDTYPLLKAFVPSVGYILSTLSLPFVKGWWTKKKLS